jgi:hypothetical protein
MQDCSCARQLEPVIATALRLLLHASATAVALAVTLKFQCESI